MKNTIFWMLLLLSAPLSAQVFSNHLIIDSKTSAAEKHDENGVSPTSATSTPPMASPDIFILGNGGFKNLFSGEGDKNSPLTGSIAVSFRMQHSETVIGFTVNTIKEIEVGMPELFGANMLTPDLGGLSFSVNYMNSLNGKWGINSILSLSNSKWKLDSANIVQASPILFKLNAVLAPWGNLFEPNSNQGENFITAYFTAGFSCRALTGNISHKDNREQYFGTRQKFFGGLELGGNLVINHTTVFINVPVLFSKNTIDNLTGVQMVIGVVIGGDVLKFKGN